MSAEQHFHLPCKVKYEQNEKNRTHQIHFTAVYTQQNKYNLLT